MDRTQAKEEIKRAAATIGQRIWGAAVDPSRFRCPRCGDMERGMEHVGGGWYRCPSCGTRGDIFALYMESKGCRFPQAMDDLAKAANIDLGGGEREELTPEMRRHYAKGRDAGYRQGYADALAGRPNAVEERDAEYRARRQAGDAARGYGQAATGTTYAPQPQAAPQGFDPTRRLWPQAAPQPQPAAQPQPLNPPNQYGDEELPF